MTRTGFITHWMGGPCSGGHIDIKPLDLVAVIKELRKYVHAAECDRACELRGKHKRTHERFRKRDCVHHQGSGYCEKLRHRNKAIHLAARREGISLKGTF